MKSRGRVFDWLEETWKVVRWPVIGFILIKLIKWAWYV
jgi:hypothetical protein